MFEGQGSDVYCLIDSYDSFPYYFTELGLEEEKDPSFHLQTTLISSVEDSELQFLFTKVQIQ